MESPYETARVAFDAVVFSIIDGQLWVRLEARDKAPQRGMLELLGGLLRKGESAEETLARKMRGILAAEDIAFQQFRTFTAPGRDPRARTVSIGYVALVKPPADRAGWYEVKGVASLAFDHLDILRNAHEYLKTHLDVQTVRHALPARFPLNRLQETYEAIEGKKYDNRNFRKRMLQSGEVVELSAVEKDVSHRPARLYRIKVR